MFTSCVGVPPASPYPSELYSIASGTWTGVPDASIGGEAVAVGSKWIESFGTTEAGCVEHCSYQHTFVSTAAGASRTLPQWQPGGTTIPDLNSAALGAKLCAPLHVPQGFLYDLTAASMAPGGLLLSQPFAVATEWYVRGGLSQARLVLERCGSRLRRLMIDQISPSSTPFFINHHLVMWRPSFAGRISNGLLLPISHSAEPDSSGNSTPAFTPQAGTLRAETPSEWPRGVRQGRLYMPWANPALCSHACGSGLGLGAGVGWLVA